MKSAVLISISCAVMAGLAPEAGARSWKFTRLVDANTPIPGGQRTFNLHQAPSFDGQNVAFNGGRFALGEVTQQGIYTHVGGLQVVADLNTPVPAGAGTFTNFGTYPTIDAGKVVFYGCGNVPTCNSAPVQVGIYTDMGGSLRVVADTNTPVPGGSGNFRMFGTSIGRGGQVTFIGRVAGGEHGVYTDIGGLHVVADMSTAMPGGAGNFSGFGSSSINGGHVAFDGGGFDAGGSGLGGIYTDLGGLHAVVETTTTLPGGTRPFASLNSPSFDGESVAFWGCIPQAPFFLCGFPFAQGIYSTVGGLHVVADTNTPVPGGTGTFRSFAAPTLDAGNLVFMGDDGTNRSGLYLETGGSGPLEKIIAPNDVLDGKTVTGCAVGKNAMRGPSLATSISFSDGTWGIYRADLIDATVDIRGVPNPVGVGTPFTLLGSLRNAGAALDGKLLMALITGGHVIPLGLASVPVPAGVDWRDVPLASFPYPQLPTSGWLLALLDSTTGKLVDAALEIVTVGGAVSGEEEWQIRSQADAFLKTTPLPLP